MDPDPCGVNAMDPDPHNRAIPFEGEHLAWDNKLNYQGLRSELNFREKKYFLTIKGVHSSFF